ncbi:uncharacterized protein LAESUDRAFT_353453 [Laetiporus sulphureus 93-53]|uniref:Secreted protein n=1 Tax=Laetiporus sulphureus 93-53 TaxID=1314785 RepID=A0A165GVG9_9APHY|nr:uncharacterized protein LAESUDRAFT_353453 [Laetiporus sulphureus 93-53]KZT10875.1 hypothetical protein LAESUDRAFT_353453 [Laetiporus sulphureus 93-53]
MLCSVGTIAWWMALLPTNGTSRAIGLPFLHGHSAIDSPMIGTTAVVAGDFWFDVSPVRTVIQPVIGTTARSARPRRFMLRSIWTIAWRMSLLPTNGTRHAIGIPHFTGRSTINKPMVRATASAATDVWFYVSPVRTVAYQMIRTAARDARLRRLMLRSVGDFIFGHVDVGGRIDRGLSSQAILRDSRTSVAV